MAAFRTLAFTIGAFTADAHTSGALRKHVGNGGFVKPLEFNHKLRVCNAYPYSAPLDVYLDGSNKLTEDEAMAYKSCRDFAAPMKAGDKLDFKVGDASAGTFSVADLPNNDATLLLVIHRHDTLSTAVAFESHVFANLANAQVAVIDTYKGKAQAVPKIKDEAGSNMTRSEELRYNSVVAVNEGKYRVSLDDAQGLEKALSNLVALNHESYVVMRTGVEAQSGDSFPEDLIVFPQSDAKMLPHAGASALAPVGVLVAMVMSLFA